MITNTYLRYLESQKDMKLEMPRVDGNILLCPDGLRWRIETTPRLDEVLHVGDVIRTNYGTGGVIVRLSKHELCCCPLRSISRSKFCVEDWDEPKATMQYHHPVVTWSIMVVPEKLLKTKKDGSLRDETHVGYLNEFVAFDGRILHLFENNRDEIILERPSGSGKTFQIALM